MRVYTSASFYLRDYDKKMHRGLRQTTRNFGKDIETNLSTHILMYASELADFFVDAGVLTEKEMVNYFEFAGNDILMIARQYRQSLERPLTE